MLIKEHFYSFYFVATYYCIHDIFNPLQVFLEEDNKLQNNENEIIRHPNELVYT